MLSFHIDDDSPTPNLDELIENQRLNEGRLVAYRRLKALLIVTIGETRIEWVPPGASRRLAGWRHSLFTCVARLWSVSSILAVPMIVITNFNGGVDVTEIFSHANIDPLRHSRPVLGTADREAKRAQWTVFAVLFVILILFVALVIN
jgi:hypothetical protein